VAYLCHESSTETGGLFELGGGFFAKLRWERAAGQTFRTGRTITPELVAASWKKIAGFDETTHPADLTQSMQPVIANVQAGPTKGGNQFIDVDRALGYEFPKATSSYDERDLAIYALGVGAAADPLDDKELRFVYEMHGQGFMALPTFAVIPPLSAMMANAKEGKFAPGLNYGLDRLLHGEQYTEVLRPLPSKATLTHKIRVKDIFDKGKHAAVVMEVKSSDESGEVLIRNEFMSIIRGAGGWGGERGPSGEANAAPDRAPDVVVTEKTAENQALLYRLSGDWNPLHADPGFAGAFGFPRPILHGLCTFGYAGRQVIKHFAGGDPRKFKSIKVRFADSVFPGETLVTEMWKESDTRILFRCKVKERDKVVISNAAIEFYDVVPTAKAAAAPAQPAAAPAAAPAAKPAAAEAPGSGDVFIAIRDHIERNPGLVAKTATIFAFKLTDPPSAWTIDLKNGNGSVSEGASGAPDVTLELSESDFIGMASGKLDPQKLYFGGKLKISGNVMASQKLGFLKHIDPEAAKAAVMKARSGAKPEAPKAAAAAEAPKEGQASKIFGTLKERLAQDPGIGAGVDAVVQFVITSPDSAWYVDLKSSPPAVERGKAKDPTTTLSLAEEDLVTLARGEGGQRLFQTGKLRVDGELRVASGRLGFLKGLL
jgi:3-hydroxyacyl-CoA dehydrogenase/3a,7a,12a-trihydroxy-5b-cholest-24-enoyl-CoA hydratase